MEHYKSTFAVTGIALLGLVTAAGVLHPGNFERAARPAAAPKTAWVDPPAAAPGAGRRSTSDLAALMKAEPAAVLPADGTMVQPLAPAFTQVAATVRPGGGAHRRKVAHRAATSRQAALASRPAEMAAPDRPGASAAGTGVADPIGDLMMRLGLGSDS